MNKELKAFAVLKQTIFHHTGGCLTTGEEEAIKVIETALKRLEDLEKWFFEDKDYKNHKALEIIKEHKLLNYVLKNEKCANMYHLSEEDKDSLKEVLKDD